VLLANGRDLLVVAPVDEGKEADRGQAQEAMAQKEMAPLASGLAKAEGEALAAVMVKIEELGSTEGVKASTAGQRIASEVHGFQRWRQLGHARGQLFQLVGAQVEHLCLEGFLECLLVLIGSRFA
jgi:hypothetical protein